MSSKDGGRDNMEKPLKGTVLCCTSVPPEQRIHMAEAAIQMGAEHKLDLTSDVTHLIVGDSNTPKYKYVAKEREDIKVLQLEWVEAVRQTWMQGDDVNLEALEEEYRLPTFAGLRICVTGFENLTFRAQLQEQISTNGGEYRGDLTKEVTHLIAHTAEGKKYQYATQWEVKVVGLRWLKDSLERRMILDESLYHPTIPQDKQGAGAWNRQARASVQLGKRNHEEEAVLVMPRKLRRTASAKLGSQSQSIWGEIVNGPQGEEPAKTDQPQPQRPLPAVKPAILETKSFATDTTGTDDDRRNLVARDSIVTGQQPRRSGIFAGFGFFIYAFTGRETSVLRDHIVNNDGEIVESLADFSAASAICRILIIVPHGHAFSDLPDVEHLNPRPDIVTDLWAERCLKSKQFFEPDEHVLSRPIRVFPIPGFEKLIINSTGLTNIDLLHVSKVVRLLGAEYDQVLKVGTSVLLCNPGKAGQDKLLHAREWRIPAVSLEWLWACIRSRQMQPFRKYLLNQGQTSEVMIPDANVVKAARHPRAVQAGLRERPAQGEQGAESGNRATFAAHRNSFANEANDHQTSRAPKANLIPGEGFLKSPQQRKGARELYSGKQLATTDPAVAANRCESQPKSNLGGEETEIDIPLQELSTNSPPKPDISTSPRKARLFRHFDGQDSLPRQEQDDEIPSAPEATSTGKTTYLPPQPDSINGAIQELLSRSKSKNATSSSSNGENKKKRLLGRALSNISNSSREGSNIRASRASSIDSVNTDGLGSVILDDTSQNKRANGSGLNGRSRFTGRASGRERNVNESSFALDDAALYREEYVEEEEPPQMTQLGYENPDDAVALREMLAERRRNRTRKGQEDVKPSDTKEEKRIKDDVAITAGGSGTGRRTRQWSKYHDGGVL